MMFLEAIKKIQKTSQGQIQFLKSQLNKLNTNNDPDNSQRIRIEFEIRKIEDKYEKHFSDLLELIPGNVSQKQLEKIYKLANFHF